MRVLIAEDSQIMRKIIKTNLKKMGVSDMSLMTVTAKDEETDSIECHGPVEHYMDLTPGKVLIVFPEDAHKVKIMKDQVTQVRKAVGKVLVTE